MFDETLIVLRFIQHVFLKWYVHSFFILSEVKGDEKLILPVLLSKLVDSD